MPASTAAEIAPECTTSHPLLHADCDGCSCSCHTKVVERQRDMATDQRNDARRIVEEARMEAAALLHMERQHGGHGRDGHLSESDLMPLLRALQIEDGR